MQRLVRLWRRLSLLLPPLLMVLLAALSWWVAQEAGRGAGGPGGPREPPQKPDYFLHDFHTRTFDAQGRITAQLSGQAMQHIPGNDTVRITQPTLRAQTAQGVLTTAQAQIGISNSDGSNVQLLGDAVVHRIAPNMPELTVRSDFLNIFPNAQRISSNKPSTVQRGDSLFSGGNLEMNGLDGTFAMRGQVSGTVVRPRR
ncbi:LPS export ABC transporter periplasmic protein LptC [Thiomonas sp. FB-Cd]|uniref:LPS export ABC transporter periplasmic protein LptC n=1 Tax=Thiomonas sp. FB-Cd TaxID=1158292 RepID=UPI0004DEF8E5|nr:LPS export ABC transporter periplasmic protein LptC [Thiomonas sp. FB-Cd]